jgi:hypothetical protein
MENETETTQETEETRATQGAQATQQAQGTQQTQEALLAEKDARIAELETQLSEAKQVAESLRVVQQEGEAISGARDKAVFKYLKAVRALNPAIPGDIIAGATIEEIDASVEKAKAIVEAVKAGLETHARGTRVPAGAPARGGISVEGLSAREKIAAGIQQKGGT